MQAREAFQCASIPKIWQQFFAYHTSEAFCREPIIFRQAALRRGYPDLEQRFGRPPGEVTVGLLPSRGKRKGPGNRSADAMMDCQFGYNSPVSAGSSVRGLHVDDIWKPFAGLLYFRLPDDDAEGGDLVLYRTRHNGYVQNRQRKIAARFVEPYRVIKYRPNTLVMYLNTARSIHGVTPRAVTLGRRRCVNFQCECYRLTTRGFYPVQRSLFGQMGTALRRTVGMRDT